uniref:Uncharacterized protein n=1 Tax=Anguilla anguilla TaxID=7936 RepID=A0A0E9QCN5_ANGAN
MLSATVAYCRNTFHQRGFWAKTVSLINVVL